MVYECKNINIEDLKIYMFNDNIPRNFLNVNQAG